MKTCEKCNLSYEDDKKFCKKCGSKLITEILISGKELARKGVYEDRLRNDPLNIKILHEYSHFLFDNELYYESIAYSLKILVLDEKDHLAREILMKSYLKLNMANEAKEIAEQLLLENPDNLLLLEYQADILYKEKNFDQAIEYYDKIIKFQPSNLSVLYNKAIILLEINKLEEASEILNSLFKEKQNDTITIIYTGFYKILNSDFKGAKNILIPILTENNNSISELHKNRGILYLTYSLCQINDELNEIKKWFNSINYKDLSISYPNKDEKILIEIISHIFKIELQISQNKESIEKLENYYLLSTKFYLTKNFDESKADLWFNTALKQQELGLFSEALISCKKTIEFFPNYNKFNLNFSEVKNLLILQKRGNKKRKRKVISVYLILIIIIIAIIITSLVIFHNYKVKSNWEKAKKENTINSYQNYIDNNPNRNYCIEAKRIMDSLKDKEAILNNAFKMTGEFYSEGGAGIFYKNFILNSFSIETPEDLNIKGHKGEKFVSVSIYNITTQKSIKYRITNFRIIKDKIQLSININEFGIIKFNAQYIEEYDEYYLNVSLKGILELNNDFKKNVKFTFSVGLH